MDGTGIKVPVNRFILYALDTVFIAITLVLQFFNADNIIWTIVGLVILNIISVLIFLLDTKKPACTMPHMETT